MTGNYDHLSPVCGSACPKFYETVAATFGQASGEVQGVCKTSGGSDPPPYVDPSQYFLTRSRSFLSSL